jgi:hypothetical protein
VTDITKQLYRKGDRVTIQGKPAVIEGVLGSHANIVRFTYEGEAENPNNLIISHYTIGPNLLISKVGAA